MLSEKTMTIQKVCPKEFRLSRKGAKTELAGARREADGAKVAKSELKGAMERT